jgi:uncharacterized membrane protein AbrB (regulator of aidB expression)
MDLCKYKNIFGEPNEGWRKKYRIFDISIGDVIVVIIFAYIISYLMKYPFSWTLFYSFILGIIIHRIFCVRTRVDKWLFS